MSLLPLVSRDCDAWRKGFICERLICKDSNLDFHTQIKQEKGSTLSPCPRFFVILHSIQIIMETIKTEIEGVVVLKPRVFEDERGYFFESYSKRDFDKQVREIAFVQDNESRSSYGVLRGLHYQKWPFTQSKLVRVPKGRVLDVVVDIRKGSPTFGKHVAVELSGDNRLQLFIPRGFAHGFAVLSEEAVFQYKCDDFYHPESEGGIAWDDPQLAIDWRLPENDIILSQKDKVHPMLKDIDSPFDFNVSLY